MREILFKAKRIDNGEWVYWNIFGELCRKSGKRTRISIKKDATTSYYDYIYQIITLIDKNTICQYTGLNDKNGNKIWENDVVRFKHEKFDFDDGLEDWERTCVPNKKEYKRNYVVEFCNTSTHYGLRFRNGSIWFMVHRMTILIHDAEVIGNIFDNPELIGE